MDVNEEERELNKLTVSESFAISCWRLIKLKAGR